MYNCCNFNWKHYCHILNRFWKMVFAASHYGHTQLNKAAETEDPACAAGFAKLTAQHMTTISIRKHPLEWLCMGFFFCIKGGVVCTCHCDTVHQLPERSPQSSGVSAPRWRSSPGSVSQTPLACPSALGPSWTVRETVPRLHHHYTARSTILLRTRASLQLLRIHPTYLST